MNKDLDCIGFENENMRDLAEVLYEEMPEYWHYVPASSTGKYHPTYALGDGGLKRHTFALLRILNYILSLECVQGVFDDVARDALRIAGLVHDGWKSGTQEEYENSQYTKFDHPLIAADQVLKHRDDGLCAPETIDFIAETIESHMGQWNTDKHSNIELPKPETDAQLLLHICDYLASRKDIEIIFDEPIETKERPKPDINTYVMPFGKYKGTLLKEVPKDYLQWLDKQDLRDPLALFVKKLKVK